MLINEIIGYYGCIYLETAFYIHWYDLALLGGGWGVNTLIRWSAVQARKSVGFPGSRAFAL